jgi:hypothetical protein
MMTGFGLVWQPTEATQLAGGETSVSILAEGLN